MESILSSLQSNRREIFRWCLIKLCPNSRTPAAGGAIRNDEVDFVWNNKQNMKTHGHCSVFRIQTKLDKHQPRLKRSGSRSMALGNVVCAGKQDRCLQVLAGKIRMWIWSTKKPKDRDPKNQNGRIRNTRIKVDVNQCCRSDMFVPHPNFPSRIQSQKGIGSGIRIRKKEFKYF